MKSKREQQIQHCSRRFRERFGLRIDDNTRIEIIKQIQIGKAKFVERQSNRISVFDINIQGEPVRIVYDKNRHVIVTVLYPEGKIL